MNLDQTGDPRDPVARRPSAANQTSARPAPTPPPPASQESPTVLRRGWKLLAGAWLLPARVVRKQAAFAGEVVKIVSGRSTITPPASDRRFADPAWQKSGIHRRGLQTYLAGRQALLELVDELGLGQKNTQRARFLTTIVADALAPTNFLLSNPLALERARQTRGRSLWRGVKNMGTDLLRNGGMPAQVDRAAFRVGKDLAVTPGAVVFRNELLELIQYAPAGPTVHGRPLLLVPPQINKYYVMDLAPGKSLSEFAVSKGIRFFAVSWRNPTAADRNWGLETYLRALLEAIDAVCAITGSPTLNMLGVCAGGITLTLLLAHLAARGDQRVHCATLLVTLLDPSAGMLGLLSTRETLALVQRYAQARGILRGRDLARLFAWLRPNDLVWNYWVNNYLLGNDPPSVDMLYWTNDTTSLPARLHADFVGMLAQDPFANRNALALLGTPLDVSRIVCDLYVVGGATDHITPWQACYAATQLYSGNRHFTLSSGGHIQSIVNPPGSPKSSFFLNPELPADPARWQAGARKQPGTWWEHWAEWLATRSGERQPAPASLGNPQHPELAAAPGTYVHGRE